MQANIVVWLFACFCTPCLNFCYISVMYVCVHLCVNGPGQTQARHVLCVPAMWQCTMNCRHIDKYSYVFMQHTVSMVSIIMIWFMRLYVLKCVNKTKNKQIGLHCVYIWKLPISFYAYTCACKTKQLLPFCVPVTLYWCPFISPKMHQFIGWLAMAMAMEVAAARGAVQLD